MFDLVTEYSFSDAIEMENCCWGCFGRKTFHYTIYSIEKLSALYYDYEVEFGQLSKAKPWNLFNFVKVN